MLVGMPAKRLPSRTIVDAFLFLTRQDLYSVQLTCAGFYRCVSESELDCFPYQMLKQLHIVLDGNEHAELFYISMGEEGPRFNFDTWEELFPYVCPPYVRAVTTTIHENALRGTARTAIDRVQHCWSGQRLNFLWAGEQISRTALARVVGTKCGRFRVHTIGFAWPSPSAIMELDGCDRLSLQAGSCLGYSKGIIEWLHAEPCAWRRVTVRNLHLIYFDAEIQKFIAMVKEVFVGSSSRLACSFIVEIQVPYEFHDEHVDDVLKEFRLENVITNEVLEFRYRSVDTLLYHTYSLERHPICSKFDV